jgi:FlgD Ig-like domain
LIGRASVGAALFFALLAVSLAAAVLVVRARDPDLALEVARLTRQFRPPEETARISFFVRESEEHAYISIVDEDDEPVKTLDSRPLEDGQRVTYHWDGRGQDGELVAPESYYLRVLLPERERDMIWPKRIKVFAPSEPADAKAGG